MAGFIDEKEPVVVLIGTVMDRDEADTSEDMQVAVSDGFVRDYPESFRAYLMAISTPRIESEARQLLVDAGAPEEVLQTLIDAGHVARIAANDELAALDNLRGFRLVALGEPVTALSQDDGLVFVGRTEDDTDTDVVISELAAEAMWNARDDEDFPSAAIRVAGDLGLGELEAARPALYGLGDLLGHRLARLERIGE